MRISGLGIIHRFIRRHPESAKALARWIETVKMARWSTMMDIRETFGSADWVKGLVVFNIGGNKFRLIAKVEFGERLVVIINVLTHAEYDRWLP